MKRIWIRVQLQQVEPQSVGVPGPQIVSPRTAQRGECRGIGMDKLAEASKRDGKDGKRHRAPDASAAVALPFVNHEVRFVHELEGKDAVLTVGSGAVMAVPPNKRRDGVIEQRVMSFLGQQFA